MIETFATDEHRIGLKPIVRRVWAPRGSRPVAVGHHRYEWLYVIAFVSPATGESFWYLSAGIDCSRRCSAREAGAGCDRGTPTASLLPYRAAVSFNPESQQALGDH